ncbi:MAG: hypothetical protein PHI06_07115 [Desulfobulbaceae bacterium]|nr:hypothetical protein [Desulfobulbaceae bacterium]
MTDQPGQVPKSGGPETIFNSGIGDDWGEAFEAEDFMSSPNDETNAGFFLPDEVTSTSKPVAPISGEAEAISPAASSPNHPSDPPKSFFTRLRAVPLPLRLVFVALPVLALVLFLTLRGKVPEEIAPSAVAPAETEVVPQPEAAAPAVLPVSEPERMVEPPRTPPPAEQGVVPPQESAPDVVATEQSTGGVEPVSLEAKGIRKKWHFPAIIIHAKTNKDQGTVLLSIDLTLVLKLAPEVMLPYDRETFVREILYQFFTNQPVIDLQRYALERGELNRKMQDWIMKQWPELQLDSVTTERYQLL